MQKPAKTAAAERSCQPDTMHNGVMASTRMARTTSTGPPGSQLELAWASAARQSTIFSTALSGNMATRHMRAARMTAMSTDFIELPCRTFERARSEAIGAPR